MDNNNTNLTTQNNAGFMMLANTDLGDIMAEELDGLDAGFERIKIPSAGSTVFEMPGDEEDTETVKEFSAVILYHHPLFAYYKNKYTGGNNPPDCCSFDGVCGTGDPGGSCRSCPLNRFGSADDGNAKACKNRRRIFVLREGEIFPLLLSLPTGSLREYTKYLKRLLSKGRKSNRAVTRFSLQKATSTNGVVYSQAQFAIDRVLTDEEHALIEKLSEQVKAYSSRVGIDYDRDESVNIDIEVDDESGEAVEPLGGV